VSWVAILAAYVQQNEGFRPDSYDDATGALVLPGQPVSGTLTIGYGHAGHDVFPGQTWTEAHAATILLRDLATAIADAEQTLGQEIFAGSSEARKVAFCDTAYELGEYKLAGFHRMIQAARAGDWPGAAKELIDSRLDAEAPARVQRNAALIATGVFPGVAPA
jgi:GH24 family phage-related lysozyme (muramidase)